MTIRFSASYADRLMACPGSANLELAIPGWQEPVRDDKAGAKGVGTDVHAILAEIAEWGYINPDWMIWFSEAVREYATKHISKRRLITETETTVGLWFTHWDTRLHNIEDGIELFLKLDPFAPKMLRFIADAAYETWVLFDADRNIFKSEQHYDVAWLQTKPQTTPDLWVYYPQIRHLVMVDYKSGAIPVQAKDNKQLLYYTVTVTEQEPEINPETITLRVMQPGNDSSHDISRAELEAWRDEALAAEQRIINKDLTLVPSDKGCTFCPANPHTRGDKGTPLCPAMMDLLYPPVIDDEIFAGI